MANEAELSANAILNQFRIRKGRIISPGKFEGERWYMPHFYELWLMGFGTSVGNGKFQGLCFGISPDERIAFPELKRRKRVRFRICDQGFVTEY